MSQYTQPRRESETFTIANGQTTSNAIKLMGRSLAALIMPAAFTGTSLTIKASIDGVTYLDAYNTDGNILTISCAANRYICLFTPDFFATEYIKIVSSGAEGAERVVTAVFMGV